MIVETLSFSLLVVCLCTYEEVYPMPISATSLGKSRIVRSLLNFTLEVLNSLLRTAEECTYYTGKLSNKAVVSWRTRVQTRLQALSLQTTEELQAILQQQAAGPAVLPTTPSAQDASPARRQIELLRAKTELARLRRQNADLDLRLRQSLEQWTKAHEQLDGKLRTRDMEYAEASRQRLQLLLMLDQERAEAEKTVDEARGRIAHLEVGIGATLRAQDELIYRLRGVELEKQTLACKVKSSQALVVRQKSELNEARDDHNVLSNKLWVRQKKHKATVRSLLLTLLFLRRFALILGDRLAPIVRSRLTLLAQWRILSATKIAAQRRLLRQHEINREVLVQLQAAHLSTQEQQRISAHWQSLYVRSVENRDKAARKYKSVLLITKHRFNLTTRRLLTGLMFLWRLNLILSRRTAEVQSILRAFEYSAEPTIEGPEGPLARIEEVSEPSASGSSMVLLAEDTSTGLGISAHLDTESASAPASAVPIRLMIEMATQTEEPEADLEPEPEVVEEQEPKQYASCSVDTSDDAPTPSTADVGVMAKEPSEYEISLRKKVITLQEQLGAMAIMNDRYLARFVDTLSTKAPNANAPAQAVLPLPLPSAQPVPVRPSSPALLPFLQDSTARLPLAPRHVRPTLKRVIFSQPLISVPFPQPAYTKPIGTPSSPMTPTPVPKAGSSHRQAFLLTPGNESFN